MAKREKLHAKISDLRKLLDTVTDQQARQAILDIMSETEREISELGAPGANRADH